LAENVSQRKETFVNLLMSITGVNKNQAHKEFDQSCERIFYYASMADKFEGNIHNPPMRGLTLAVKESIGIVASIMNDHQPLLSLSTIISSLFANGNASIIVPSEKTSLIATSLYQVF
jgi:aldehyde dehydrogenase (NAD+)